MNHYLVFDFVNGKTKMFPFETTAEALKFRLFIQKMNLEGRKEVQIYETTIMLDNVCSITYEAYPKEKE